MTGIRVEGGPLSRPGGVVVVTQFRCRSLMDVIVVWLLHHVVKPAVTRTSDDFVGVKLFVDWRTKNVRSVSLWRRGEALFDMGEVGRHIRAARVPARRKIPTSCGVFGYYGDWRTVMFGAGGYSTESPLAVPQRSQSEREGNENAFSD